MSYLLDTHVVSELTAERPDQAVVRWYTERDPAELRLSVLSVGELRFGVERLPAGAKRARLQRTLDDWIIEFDRQLVDFDLQAAEVWGRLRRRAEAAKRPMPPMDAMLAATAQAHGLTLVTRNTRAFEGWGGPTLNPWLPQPSVG